MANNFYSEEINVQIVITLLKANNIKKVIISPGATNVNFVACVQSDDYFEKYSAVDERSAAYMACGLSAETGEPVVLSCTGATASRNYIPALTEAYYRKLPVLAITSTMSTSGIGHLIPQLIDRTTIQNDIAKVSVQLPIIKDDTDRWDCEMKVNTAILALKHHGGGPAHINLPTTYSVHSVKEMPAYKKISRYTGYETLPELPQGRVAIFIGSHKPMSASLSNSIDKFCQSNDAVVFCDHTSSYKGKYRVLYSIAAIQTSKRPEIYNPELLIHIGEVSGDYFTMNLTPNQVWRVSEDGEIRDKFHLLQNVFEMPEEFFFNHYSQSKDNQALNSYLSDCRNHLSDIYGKLPDLPYSNPWIASVTASKLPENSSIHFGILNSLRSWNFFELPNSVSSFCNVGGFGIDGCVSSLIGASIDNREKLYFGVVGDLAFFYDLNSLGNRHVGSNLRLMLINNGLGVEFKNYTHHASRFGCDANEFMAAAGHYGNKSPLLIKHYAEDLDFEYLTASSKDEYEKVSERFLTPVMTDKPMLLEVFVSEQDEIDAIKMIYSMDQSVSGGAKEMAKQILGAQGFNALKKIMGK